MSTEQSAALEAKLTAKKTGSFFFAFAERTQEDRGRGELGPHRSFVADCRGGQRKTKQPLISHKFMRLLDRLSEESSAGRAAPRLPAISSFKSLKAASLFSEQQTGQQRTQTRLTEENDEFSFAPDEKEQRKDSSTTAESASKPVRRSAEASEPKILQFHKSAAHSIVEFTPFCVLPKTASSVSFGKSSSLQAAQNFRSMLVPSEFSAVQNIINTYQQRTSFKRKQVESESKNRKQTDTSAGSSHAIRGTGPQAGPARSNQNLQEPIGRQIARMDRSGHASMDRGDGHSGPSYISELESKNERINQLTLKYYQRIVQNTEMHLSTDLRGSSAHPQQLAVQSSLDADPRPPALGRALPRDAWLQPVQRRKRVRLNAHLSPAQRA